MLRQHKRATGEGDFRCLRAALLRDPPALVRLRRAIPRSFRRHAGAYRDNVVDGNRLWVDLEPLEAGDAGEAAESADG